MTQVKNIEIEKTIGYYQERLNHILSLWEDGESDLLDKNKDKVQRLVEEYQRFENDQKYMHCLTWTIKEQILGL